IRARNVTCSQTCSLPIDEIRTHQTLEDTDKHVKLITDVANWASSKGYVKPLVYTPPFYNQAWTGEDGQPYLEAFRDVPENVEIKIGRGSCRERVKNTVER